MKMDFKNPTAEIAILWISLIGGAGCPWGSEEPHPGDLEIGEQQRDYQLPGGCDNSLLLVLPAGWGACGMAVPMKPQCISQCKGWWALERLGVNATWRGLPETMLRARWRWRAATVSSAKNWRNSSCDFLTLWQNTVTKATYEKQNI